MEAATTGPWTLVDALDDGRGFVDLSRERLLVARGADSRKWLGDLVTADVATLQPGRARRSLLLTPTGRIRADLLVAQIEADGFLIVQAVDQPESAGRLLRPYVLSSAVELEEADDALSVLFFPATDELLALPRSGVGPKDLEIADRDGAVLVDAAALEVWRIGRGDPRMGHDFDAGALPAEAGLERVIDTTKGCFLGQESVAKVRNLGHPPTVLRHLRADEVLEPGTSVTGPGGPAGRLTSVAPSRDGGSVVIARVDWSAADAPLRISGGPRLFPLPD